MAGVSSVLGQLGCYRQAVTLGVGALHSAARSDFLIEDLYLKPLQESLDQARSQFI